MKKPASWKISRDEKEDYGAAAKTPALCLALVSKAPNTYLATVIIRLTLLELSAAIEQEGLPATAAAFKKQLAGKVREFLEQATSTGTETMPEHWQASVRRFYGRHKGNDLKKAAAAATDEFNRPIAELAAANYPE